MTYRFLLVLSLSLFVLAGCTTESATIDTPESDPEVRIFTAEEVADIRSASDIDTQALAIPGVISVGIAGDAANAYIQVLCADTVAVLHADSLLGTSLNGVPVRYMTSDAIQAQIAPAADSTSKVSGY